MALDPQAKFLLEQMEAAGAPPMSQLSPEEARLTTDFSALAGEPEEVGKIENRKIAGLGGEIPVRIYTPKGEGPFPALVYYHGGGWVIGDLETVEVPCRLLTNLANCVVISVDYRLAPEHKFLPLRMIHMLQLSGWLKMQHPLEWIQAALPLAAIVQAETLQPLLPFG